MADVTPGMRFCTLFLANLSPLPFQNGGPEVKKRIDDVRLLESRKSARLIGHGSNTDFSKLADFNIVHERKRINSETNSETSGSTR